MAAAAIELDYGQKSRVALPALFSALGDELTNTDRLRRSPLIRQRLVQAIAAVSPESQHAKELLKSKEPNLRAAGLWYLIHLHSIDKRQTLGILPLISLLRDRSPLVRHAAAWATRILPDCAEQIVPVLAELLADNEVPGAAQECVAAAAALHLSQFGAKARPAIPALRRVAASKDDRPAYHACRALASIATHDRESHDELIDFFVDVLRDKSIGTYHRCLAAQAISQIGPTGVKAVPDLITLLSSDVSSEIKIDIISALQRMEMSASIVAALRAARSDADSKVRDQAGKVLGNWNHR
jgi:HEAT repeat protein